MGHKIVSSVFKSINCIEWEQDAQKGQESELAKRRIQGGNTGVCLMILQSAVVRDVELGVLRW